MKRLHDKKIDDANFYNKIWEREYKKGNMVFDAVRQRALIEPVKNGDFIIDVGAGLFGPAQYIAEKTDIKPRVTVWYDQSKVASDIVKERVGEKTFWHVIGPCEHIFFAPNYFDLVVAGEIIEHMEEPDKFAKELIRVCKPGGTVVVSTVNTKCENAIKHGDYPDHLWEFEPEDLINFFRPYGETEYRTVGDYHFIYFRKP